MIDDDMVMDVVGTHPCCTTGEVAREIGEDHRLVLFRLRALEDAGVLESVPGSSPRQWRVSGCTATREGHTPPRYRKVGFTVEWRGRVMSIREWAEERDVPRYALHPRLDTGEGAADALMSPFRVDRDPRVGGGR